MRAPDEEAAIEEEKVSKQRHRCLICGLCCVILLAVAAIVIPLVVPCDCDEVEVLEAGGEEDAQSVDPEFPAGSPTATSPTPGQITPSAPVAAPAPAPVMPAPVMSSPTAAPTTQRLSQFIEIFLVPLSGRDVFEDETTPQYRAAIFMADEDLIGPSLPTLPELEDRYALATFYYAMNGDEWLTCSRGDTECPIDSSWLDSNLSHCEWNSVECNDEGRVTGIFYVSADGNGLSGTIPKEIALLRELQNFVAVNNLIQGPFPEEFANLENMERLILIGNRVSGELPEDFLSNSPVQQLLLSNNDLSGNIPLSLGSLTTLTQLFLDGNRFDGVIPNSLGSLEILGRLNLANNVLRGDIPSDIYGLTSLEYLGVDGNLNIQGEISTLIGGMLGLTEIHVGGTGMGGTLPSEIFDLPRLAEIDVTDAQFSGGLSEDFVKLAGSIRRLKLSNNAFTGNIPIAFDNLSILNILQLQRNDLVGEISSEICSRRGDGYNDLRDLSTDCQEVTCSCCTQCFN